MGQKLGTMTEFGTENWLSVGGHTSMKIPFSFVMLTVLGGRQ